MKNKLAQSCALVSLILLTLTGANAQENIPTYNGIELNRGAWPYIRFNENGSYVARIQGTGGNFAVTSTNGATNFFTVNSTTGAVGIGTSSPAALLHINSTVDARKTFRIYWNNDLTKYLSIWQGTGGAVLDPIGTGLLLLGYDQPTNVIVGNSGGSLGIGTTSPSAKLHINGNGGSNVDLLINGRITTGDASNAGGMYVNSSQSMFVGQSSSTSLGFYNNGSWRMIVDNSGNVGVGTTSPDAKLAVSGQVHAQEVKVSVAVPGPDYVFEKDYKLSSLEEIKNYIDQNKHLPEVPSAKEMEKNGVQLGEMNMLLLKKIEELTLYVIEQNKLISKQNERISTLENKK